MKVVPFLFLLGPLVGFVDGRTGIKQFMGDDSEGRVAYFGTRPIWRPSDTTSVEIRGSQCPKTYDMSFTIDAVEAQNVTIRFDSRFQLPTTVCTTFGGGSTCYRVEGIETFSSNPTAEEVENTLTVQNREMSSVTIEAHKNTFVVVHFRACGAKLMRVFPEVQTNFTLTAYGSEDWYTTYVSDGAISKKVPAGCASRGSALQDTLFFINTIMLHVFHTIS